MPCRVFGKKSADFPSHYVVSFTLGGWPTLHVALALRLYGCRTLRFLKRADFDFTLGAKDGPSAVMKESIDPFRERLNFPPSVVPDILNKCLTLHPK
jgi:hypothetical protein